MVPAFLRPPGLGVSSADVDGAPDGGGRLPDWLIIGAMKSGTTSLAAYLREHPGCFVAPEKEVHFFDYEFRWAFGADWYRQRFRGAGSLLAGEATPSYMHRPEVPARIASVVPDAKLIAILRDPVDRAYSQYWHHRREGREEREFLDAVEDPELDYLGRGRYLEQLERICEHFPREQLLVLLFDDLDAQPQETFVDVCRFLGVDETVIPANVGEARNSHRKVRAPRTFATMYRFKVWDKLPRRMGRRLHEAMVMPDEYPPLDPDVEAKMRARCAPDNHALAQWLGRELPATWTAPA
jgi:hypothetical protein